MHICQDEVELINRAGWTLAPSSVKGDALLMIGLSKCRNVSTISENVYIYLKHSSQRCAL